MILALSTPIKWSWTSFHFISWTAALANTSSNLRATTVLSKQTNILKFKINHENSSELISSSIWHSLIIANDIGREVLISILCTMYKSLGRRECTTQYIPPLGSVRIHYPLVSIGAIWLLYSSMPTCITHVYCVLLILWSMPTYITQGYIWIASTKYVKLYHPLPFVIKILKFVDLDPMKYADWHDQWVCSNCFMFLWSARPSWYLSVE